MHKIIERENSIGKLHIIGNGHAIELRYGTPEWAHGPDGDETYFIYKGQEYWLSEFMRSDGHGSPFADYDGYASDSFFSGVLVRYGTADDNTDYDWIRAYWYYS